jgi:hypothetical protein
VTGQKWSGSHRRLSEQMRAHAIGGICHFCALPMLPGQPLDLDHAPDGRGYRGVAHRSCNRRDGALKSLAIQRARRQQRWRRFTVTTEGCLGVEISVDRSYTAVVHAGRGRNGRVVLELRAYFDGTDVADAIADMIRQRPRAITATLLDPRSPAATLLEPLAALRVQVTEASPHIVAAAHGCFLDELRAGRLAIEKHPALDAAAKYAMTRSLAGSEALERRKPQVDTSPIVAAELACWGALHIARAVPKIHMAGRPVKIASSSGGPRWCLKCQIGDIPVTNEPGTRFVSFSPSEEVRMAEAVMMKNMQAMKDGSTS